MQQLDLKFVAHHGEFIKQRMGGRDELAGRDVILVHRLLKNGVKDRLGDRAYALFSEFCVEAMGSILRRKDLSVTRRRSTLSVGWPAGCAIWKAHGTMRKIAEDTW